MNDLIKLKVKDEMTSKIYRLLGFTSAGDDRSGFPVTSIILYDDNERLRHTITSVLEMKRLTLMRD